MRRRRKSKAQMHFVYSKRAKRVLDKDKDVSQGEGGDVSCWEWSMSRDVYREGMWYVDRSLVMTMEHIRRIPGSRPTIKAKRGTKRLSKPPPSFVPPSIRTFSGIHMHVLATTPPGGVRFSQTCRYRFISI